MLWKALFSTLRRESTWQLWKIISNSHYLRNSVSHCQWKSRHTKGHRTNLGLDMRAFSLRCLWILVLLPKMIVCNSYALSVSFTPKSLKLKKWMRTTACHRCENHVATCVPTYTLIRGVTSCPESKPPSVNTVPLCPEEHGKFRHLLNAVVRLCVIPGALKKAEADESFSYSLWALETTLPALQTREKK